MSPLVALHVTREACRDSIRHHGLLCNRPTSRRIFGVFVFSDTDEFHHPTFARSRGARRIVWAVGPRQDVWQVAYIGPLTPDSYVTNGLVLLEAIGPSHVTLVTGNND